jgi:molybdopterin converting factor small subunit
MRILFFAQLRDAVAREELEWPGAGPWTADQLWHRLLAECPGLAAHRAGVRLARNGEYAAPDTLFGEADEVALIPPVSGG